MTTSEPGTATVLVVEDEKGIQEFIKELLLEGKYRKHAVYCAGDAATARLLMREKCPDLVILDLMLPPTAPSKVAQDPGNPNQPDDPGEGLLLFHQLKAIADVPILIYTAKHMAGRVALLMGADDLIVKSKSDIDEIEFRVETLLRRTQGAKPSGSVPKVSKVGELVIDESRRQVALGGQQLTLTPTEFVLLSTLARSSGKPLPRADLVEAVWGSGADRDEKAQALDAHIQRLRGKLGDAPGTPQIVAERGFGYKIAEPDEMAE